MTLDGEFWEFPLSKVILKLSISLNENHLHNYSIYLMRFKII